MRGRPSLALNKEEDGGQQKCKCDFRMRSGGVLTGPPQHRSRPRSTFRSQGVRSALPVSVPFFSPTPPLPLGGGGRHCGVDRGCGGPAVLYLAVWLQVSCFPSLDFSLLICKMREKGNISNPFPHLPTDR